MATTTVKLVSEIPSTIPDDTQVIDLRSLNNVQKKYFMEAWDAFQSNMICWNFENIIFDSVRFYERVSDMPQHPLYRALDGLFCALAVNQGRAADTKDKTFYIVI